MSDRSSNKSSPELGQSKNASDSGLAKDLPVVAALKPSYQELKEGKSYLWCSCGLSKKQPFCDFSHKDTGFEPIRYKAEQDEDVLFCECKQTKEPPFCDGAHNNLPGGYQLENPDSDVNKAVELVFKDQQGKAKLNGDCYVASIDESRLKRQGNVAWIDLITQDTGALYQSLFYFRQDRKGESDCYINFADAETILLVSSGSGEVNIEGQIFAIEANTGIYVRANETFSFSSDSEQALQVYASVCPLQTKPNFVVKMTNNFDDNHPERIIDVDEDNRNAMGARFFQILVDKKMGSSKTTQFIGEIPPSMAAFHRHLYEETLVIIRGEGYMWTENVKAAVKAGDIIFLPRKQVHSLQCTNPEGMFLAGVIYPGDNPSVNY